MGELIERYEFHEGPTFLGSLTVRILAIGTDETADRMEATTEDPNGRVITREIINGRDVDELVRRYLSFTHAHGIRMTSAVGVA